MSGLVEVARFLTPVEGELARSFIESFGLNAVVFDGNVHVNVDGVHSGVRLMVPEDEIDEVLEVLKGYRR